MERAAKATDTRDWDTRWHFYRWISDHEVLFFRDSSLESSAAPDWNFYKRDTLTGQQTSLAALSHLAQDSFYKHSLCAISPDGKRICWTGKGITVAAIDGEHSFRLDTRETGGYAVVTWMADSSHLIAYSTQAEGAWITFGTIYDAKTQKSTQRLKVSAHTFFEAVSAHSRLLTCVWPPLQSTDITETVEIDEGAAGKETQPFRHYFVPLPQRDSTEEAVFSPQGDRVAWILTQESDPLSPAAARLHRLLPAFSLQRPPQVSLWVSRIDGSQMHEIGCVPLQTDANEGWRDVIEETAWLPDGKRLSFRHKDALYTVSAD